MRHAADPYRPSSCAMSFRWEMALSPIAWASMPPARQQTGLNRRASFCAFTPTPRWTILIAVSAKRPVAIMASKTSSPETQPVIDMADLAARLAARRAEAGLPDLPRNSGTRRTPSKRALLKAIEDLGGKW